MFYTRGAVAIVLEALNGVNHLTKYVCWVHACSVTGGMYEATREKTQTETIEAGRDSSVSLLSKEKT